MLKFISKIFKSVPQPISKPRDPLSEEYLDLMVEWGTIADIPALVRIIRGLKARVAELEAKHEQ